MTVTVNIALAADSDLCDASELGRVAEAVLAAEQVSDQATLAVTLVDDAEIQALNSQYRDLDAPTDVLAFAAQEGVPLVLAPGLPVELGDVVISLDTARRQAEALGHALAAELALLTIHGCLHLLGYDHDAPEAQARMWARQAELLVACGYPDVGANRPEMCEQPDDD